MDTSESTLYERTVILHESRNDNPLQKAVVFIHGGAWVDKRNTPHDFDHLSKTILSLTNGILSFAMYGIEYRLSPGVKHPTHVNDVIENLGKLIKEKGITQLHLVGHSVGATLAWQTATAVNTSKQPSGNLEIVQSCLRGIYLVDGIFSLSELLNEYPDYIGFVSQAFSDDEEKFEEFHLSIERLPSSVDSIHLLHSYRDELLSLRQPRYMSSLLQEHKIAFETYFDDMGLHNEVYQSTKLAKYILNNVTLA